MTIAPETPRTATATTFLRRPTLDTLGLGSVLPIFRNGRLPITAEEAVERVFGPAGERGALVISGANGIVGAGKTMQLGSRLVPFGVPVVALDLPGAPDGIGRQYPGLVRAFGKVEADQLMAGIVRMSYDGKSLPERLDAFRPRFLLEAIPEVLELKRAHYAMFREKYPELGIRSVTSGFPARELGVGVAHPAFPHEINKVWETVEAGESAVPELLWALGLVPMPVSDDWSFVLDVIFCGVTLAALRYAEATNMPYWKVDKFVRRELGPNPFRAHDAIGAKGANFLTWSCLHHLAEVYGDLFRPARPLVERKDTGQTWFPPNHLRPLVDWSLTPEEEAELRVWLLGPLVQMTSLMLHENRAHLAHLNLIGEVCAQLRRGVVALLRGMGAEEGRRLVAAYHQRVPAAAEGSSWHPEALDRLEEPEARQLYVNAEHDGTVGVVTLGRESYNWDVDAELNRALDWLREEGIERLILSADFHLATQLVGADTAEFFPGLEDEAAAHHISAAWSRTARRLHDDFRSSVGFVHGKRCLGGMLELMLHCHALVVTDETSLGFPEVTLPVVPGMEGCHWPFRRSPRDEWPRVLDLLLSGRPVRGRDAAGWLADFSGDLEDALAEAWRRAREDDGRRLDGAPLEDLREALPGVADTGDDSADPARSAIWETVVAASEAPLGEALEVQARHSAGFMTSKACRKGAVGAAYARTMKV